MQTTSTDRVSPQRITELLQGSVLNGDAAVVTVESKVLTGGLMADTLALSLSYEGGTGDEPASMVVKLPSSNPDSHAAGMEMGGYAREISFYSDIASKLSMRVPDCYHASIDTEANTFALLLEDARPGQVPYPEMDDARIVADKAMIELARFHASTWEDSAFKNHPAIPVALDEPYLTMATEAADKGWEIFKPLTEGVCSPEDSARLDRILASSRQWRFAANQVSCMVHGDFRNANLMYTDAGEVVTLDWQTYSWSNPGNDLAHFLVHSLTPEQQEDWIPALLDLYLQELLNNGVKDFNKEALAFNFCIGVLSEVIMIMATIFAVGANGLSEQAKNQMLEALRMTLPALEKYNAMKIVDEGI